jgi:hypothetical protein
MNRVLFQDICLVLITVSIVVADFKGWGWL